MENPTKDHISLGATAQNVIRIIIASYFAAVALHLISGSDLSQLAALILPETAANLLSSVIMFGLALLVMMGLYMRPAALFLGLITLGGSYMTLSEVGIANSLDIIWRDLALATALVLTYAENAPSNRHLRRPIRKSVAPRRVKPTPSAPKTARPDVEPALVAPRQARPWQMIDTALNSDENIFVENGVYG